MGQFDGISTAMLERWLVDTTALKDHRSMPEHTLDPAYPGRDWYRQNFKDLTEELERRKKA